ncbi:MAG: hypothetical protein GTO71_07400 [Woeseiaceae bacterium]|nr:hypothetical protein [Woeseiaceae bacterium]NIP20921.1 hypothetical protein [Woeseiaceae bacterium]NIS89688.1 hypothetical protein [Woeseiaceae bacterium]
MQNDIQRQILGAMLLVLRPIARAFLKAGIGYREFAEISKTAFVDVAGKDYGLRGRPTNISRVAVMTGLTRKEVRRIRDKTESGDAIEMTKLAPMSQVMHRWFTEGEYTSENGVPKVLDFDSGDPSFAGLVKKYGGDIPPGAMRTELKRMGVVEELESGQLKAVSRSVVGLENHEKFVRGLAHVLYPAALSLDHNIDKDRSENPWIHVSAFTHSVGEHDVRRIRRVCSDKASGLVESVDDFLAAYETLHEVSDRDDECRAVGVGVFYFEDESTESGIFE